MLSRHVQRASLILGAILAASLFFLSGAALRLLVGPVSLGPLTEMIEDALNNSVTGVVVRFDQAVLEWTRAEGRVNLMVLGTRVFDANGHIIAQAPKADLDFDAAAILAGDLKLKRFALIGVQLTGVRSMEGRLRLGFGPDQDEDLLDVVRRMLGDGEAGSGSFETFAVRNARLAFRDEPSGLFIVSPNTSFTLQGGNGQLDAVLDSDIEISGMPAHLAASAVLRADGTLAHGSVGIKGLSLPALVENSQNFQALAPYRIVADLDASFSLDEQGGFIASTFSVKGEGAIATPFAGPPLQVKELLAEGRYDAVKGQLALDTLSLQGDGLSAKAKAAFALGWNGAALETVAGDLTASGVRVNLPAQFRQPVLLSQLSVQASYDRKAQELVWQRAIVRGGPLSAELSGKVRFDEGVAPAVKITGSVRPLSVAAALSFWPAGLSTGARSWIEENVGQGRIGPMRIAADLPAGALDASPLPETALDVSFPFENVSARYIASMTPITGGRGQARLTGNTFRLTVASAAVGPLRVTSGDFQIPELHQRGTVSRITAHAEGAMADVMRLIDQRPLGYPKRFGIEPAAVAGQAAVDLNFTVPLLRDLALDHVGIGVEAKVLDLGLPIDGRRLEHGMATFSIDSASLVSRGTAELSGVPVNFTWTEEFAPIGDSTRIDVSGTLNNERRAKLGLSEPSWLSGPMPVTGVFTGRRFQLTDAAVSADLTQARADFPILSIAKQPGVAARGTVRLKFSEGTTTFSDIEVEGEGLSVRGGLSLDKSGALTAISLPHLRAGDNDFAITAHAMPGGGLAYRVEGRSIDASHFFRDTENAGANPAAPTQSPELLEPISVEARLDRMVIRKDESFSGVTLAIAFGHKEKLTAFSLDAKGTGTGKVTGAMTVANGMRNLSLDTEDAGAFIGTFMGFSSVRGGRLGVRVSFPADGPVKAAPPTILPDYEGTLTISDAVLTDQPFLTRLFSAGSLDGLSRLLQGEGIGLRSATVPFSARGKMVTIREGRASGPAIGATFTGMLDRDADRVDLTGTLVPAYGLNSILGSVPILGNLLISKKGEGVFGLTYSMKGNLTEPELMVNPLSVLTPGIFRRIFEFSSVLAPPPRTVPEAAPQAQPAPPQTVQME